MSLVSLRQRFLVVMGLPALVACSKESASTVPSASASAAASAPVATTTSTTSARPDDWGTGSASPSASAAPSASVGVAALNGRSGGGGCGNVTICKPAGKKPEQPAAAPYEACAATLPADREGERPHLGGTFDVAATKDARAMNATMCCWVAPRAGCGGGRPLRGAHAPIVAEAIPSRDWSCDLATKTASPDPALAARFLADALFEHASVASFARTSLQLLALGAPPELVAAAHTAALEEVEHARITFALAQRLGATPTGPGPLAIDAAPFATTVAAFVRDTFLDGCVAETSAALDVAARAEDVTLDDVERGALASIARDERSHSELAWRMLAWAIRTFGEPARAVLADATASLERSPLVDEVVRPCVEALLTPPCGADATPGESSAAPTP